MSVAAGVAEHAAPPARWRFRIRQIVILLPRPRSSIANPRRHFVENRNLFGRKARVTSRPPNAGFWWRRKLTAAELQCPLWVKSRHRRACQECPLYPRKRTFFLRVKPLLAARTRPAVKPAFQRVRRQECPLNTNQRTETLCTPHFQLGHVARLQGGPVLPNQSLTQRRPQTGVIHQTAPTKNLAC